MLLSIAHEMGNIEIPAMDIKIEMLPFNLATLEGVPEEFWSLVATMVEKLPNKTGEAYLTVRGKLLKPKQTLRRPGPHIDGNYINETLKWGGDNGWKVGQGGKSISTEHHKLSYQNPNGGMLIASNYQACMGWTGTFDAEAGEGGDCSHIKLINGFMLKANTIYCGSSQFIHESLPVDEEVHRTMIRITLPINYRFLANIIL